MASRSCSVSALIRAQACELVADAPWPLTKQKCIDGFAIAAMRAQAIT